MITPNPNPEMPKLHLDELWVFDPAVSKSWPTLTPGESERWANESEGWSR